MRVRGPRGTVDILNEEISYWQWMENQANEICRRFHYQEVRTPIFEMSELFHRGVGETTDIVEKETYTFIDRGDRSITLRPEGTAGTVRSYVENKVYGEPQPIKWFYIGPMFRYERPQAGRYRQFHQFGVEVFGSDDPALDSEVIILGLEYFRLLGLKNVRVEVNNIGDLKSRLHYKEKLIEYFEPFKDDLAKDAKERLYKNPLRILDTKDPKTKEIAVEAPSISSFINDESKKHFETVLNYLELLKIPFQVNERLVRGIDYYTQTAFEYMLDGQGAQASTIGGGGRYNGLVEEIGGPDIPGIGFAIGLERVLLALKEQSVNIPTAFALDCYLISLGEAAKQTSFHLLNDLRQSGMSADQDYLDRKMKAQFKAADKANAKYVVIIGEQEVTKGVVQLKQLSNGHQEEVKLDELVSYLKRKG